ncbi:MULTISPECIES: DUF456 domain-containing protein [Deinococcus]|uniref:DUF456 domain-containing protein n=1 Tax=Deinococcus geothermalis (strain DSM 11300 / CIP 105573 / AG-3a) TaxID=319795 RepID=Q1IYE2_DEIGD|nr:MULTISPECIES: DUF456 domain-containing protein [Deinococcus]ABF45742.1 protein of unknown function DUF456 [Deinococcus geothermalis DSM 11300]MBI0444881.1 DUF456 domain-containing protein [Deinococcus sp. DB0503]TDE85427.1 DUF456 domain-containing protein [Deinococcus sp. S9]
MSLAFVVFLLAWIIGMIGTFVPALPATVIIFAGTVAATLINGFQLWPDLPFLVTFAVITFLVSMVDNVASAWGARRYGGSKQAGWGALIGGLVGLFLPFGLIVGPLGGALVVELLVVRKPVGAALRAAWGTLVGLLTGIAAKLVLHFLIGMYELWRLWDPARSLV